MHNSNGVANITLGRNVEEIQLILLLFLSCILLATTRPASWDCVSPIRSGNWTVAARTCTMQNEVELNGDLTIVGINSSGLTTVYKLLKNNVI